MFGLAVAPHADAVTVTDSGEGWISQNGATDGKDGPIIEQMRAAAPEVTLVAKSNVGMPELIDMRAVYRTDAPTMAGWATAYRDAPDGGVKAKFAGSG